MSFEDANAQLDKVLDAIIAGNHAAAEAAHQAAIAAEKYLEAEQEAIKAREICSKLARKVGLFEDGALN